MTSKTQRLVLAALLAGAALSARAAAPEEIRIGATQPITGRFAFAGVHLNAGLSDYIAYANEQGLVKGKKLVYFYEDTGYDTEKAVATFKKMMAQHSPVVIYGESTGQGKAIGPELNSRYKVLYGWHLVLLRARRSEEPPVHVRLGPDLLRPVRHPPRVHREAPEEGEAEGRLLLQRHRVRQGPDRRREGARRRSSASTSSPRS